MSVCIEAVLEEKKKKRGQSKSEKRGNNTFVGGANEEFPTP